MSDYFITEVSDGDHDTNEQIHSLLESEGIHKDKHLDYTCAMFDESMHVIATGSCFSNTLRCLAVSSTHQGEGLMNQIITHLISVQFTRGNTHLFLYTKAESAPFFSGLGFYEIANIKNKIVFMENIRNGFSSYLKNLRCESQLLPKQEKINTEIPIPLQPPVETATHPQKKIAALVINANPFTSGHQYLIEKASQENDILHLFIVEEDASLIPFAIRKKLVLEGTSHLNNIIYHDSGSYIISNATFPAYFQKDDRAVMEGHAELDLAIFIKIAKELHITKRYIGEEPFSEVTQIYNTIMSRELPENGINCAIIPRKEFSYNTPENSSASRPISASLVRQALKDRNFKLLEQLVPETTLQYFKSKEASPVLQRIDSSTTVIHH